MFLVAFFLALRERSGRRQPSAERSPCIYILLTTDKGSELSGTGRCQDRLLRRSGASCKTTTKRLQCSYLAGAGRDASDKAARRELLVEEGVQRAFRLTLDQLALHVVRLRHGLKRNNDKSPSK